MSTHTPGPWEWFISPNVNPRKPHMKFLKGSDGQGFAHTVGLQEPTDTANASLIVAAPELLEALKNLLREPMAERTVDAAKRAIAKAEGKP